MLTYMDTVTLLVTLFVLLLSFSTVSPEKYAAVAEGLSLKKYGSGILSGSQGIADGAERGIEPLPLAPEPKSDAAANERRAIEMLERRLAEQGLDQDVEVKVSDNLVHLQLRDSVLFQSGRASLTDNGVRVLSRLAPMLTSGDFLISVEGHTDDVPISTAAFPSNWELSGARAAAVVRELVDLGVTANRLQMVGFAHTRPIAGNDTPEGRQRNRRVNLVLNVTADEAGDVLRDQ